VTNPFLNPASAPAQQANPFATQQTGTAPVAAPWLATPTATEQASYPSAPNGAVAPTPAGPPPALNIAGLSSVGAPPPSGSGKGPSFVEMFGRLLLIFPLQVDTVPKNPKFIQPGGSTTQDRMTATIVILDDGAGGMSPIQYGGNPMAMPPGSQPHTDSAPLPYVRKAMWISQSQVVAQLRDALPSTPGGTPGMKLGRIMKAGPAHNDPWFLQAPTEADLTAGRQYLEAVQAGAVPHPLA